MTPFGLLPYAALGLLILLLQRRFPGRPAVPAAAVAWAAFLIVVTELTSAFSAFTFRCVLVAWTLGSAVVLALLFAGGAPAAPSPRPPLTVGLQLQRAGVVSVALLVGLVALWAPPNNFDTMVYHMSRACHWIQNHTIAPYPTHILRQLHQNPWSDWAVAHLQLLAGGDRLANTVQWLSMMGSLLVAGTVAGQLGGDRRAQVLAAVLSATIPMGVIEASTAKNDYVAAFWLLCFVHFLLRIRQTPDDRGRGDAFLAGGALGLAVLTKATCYLFALPFMLWLLWPLRSRLPWKTGVLVAGTALLLNTGHYWRSFEVYGRPLGADREGRYAYANDALTLPLFFSNVLRNASLHLDTRVPTVNRLTARAIVRAHGILGIDPSDPRITWSGITFDGPRERTDTDTAGNLWHLLLAIAAVVLVLASPSPARRGAYACALAGAFLLFCAYLRWQPWHSRLHLPVFVLACPLIAAVLCARLGALATGAISVVLVLWALPPALANQARPLLGAHSVFRDSRDTQYFRNWPDLERPYRRAVRALRATGCSRLGLYKDVVWEYPLWPLLRAQRGGVRIEHVGVENASAPLASREPFASFSPCAIVSFEQVAGTSLTVGSATYERSWSSGRMSLFTESPARTSGGPGASDRP